MEARRLLPAAEEPENKSTWRGPRAQPHPARAPSGACLSVSLSVAQILCRRFDKVHQKGCIQVNSCSLVGLQVKGTAVLSWEELGVRAPAEHVARRVGVRARGCESGRRTHVASLPSPGSPRASVLVINPVE